MLISLKQFLGVVGNLKVVLVFSSKLNTD